MAARPTSRLLSPIGISALIGSLLLVLLTLFGPTVWGEQASTTAIAHRLLGASWQHPFGTDQLGRDTFARVMVAALVFVQFDLTVVIWRGLSPVVTCSIRLSAGRAA